MNRKFAALSVAVAVCLPDIGGLSAQESRPYEFVFAEEVIGNFEAVATTQIVWRGDLPYPAESSCGAFSEEIQFSMDQTGLLRSISFDFEIQREDGDSVDFKSDDTIILDIDGDIYEYGTFHVPDRFENVSATHILPDAIQVVPFRGFRGVRRPGENGFYDIARIQQPIISAKNLRWEVTEIDTETREDDFEITPDLGAPQLLDNRYLKEAVDWCSAMMRSPERLIYPQDLLEKLDQ